jgi:hypothetical protein
VKFLVVINGKKSEEETRKAMNGTKKSPPRILNLKIFCKSMVLGFVMGTILAQRSLKLKVTKNTRMYSNQKAVSPAPPSLQRNLIYI